LLAIISIETIEEPNEIRARFAGGKLLLFMPLANPIPVPVTTC
jgi:hypothetical protein